jgi:hypothetical protein
LLLAPDWPKVEVLRTGLMDADAALALPKFQGIIVFGSKGSWLVAAPAVEGESVLAIPLFADVSAALSAAAFETCDVVDVVDVAEVNAELMLMSCPSSLSEIIWPTIAVESTGEVGS